MLTGSNPGRGGSPLPLSPPAWGSGRADLPGQRQGVGAGAGLGAPEQAPATGRLKRWVQLLPPAPGPSFVGVKCGVLCEAEWRVLGKMAVEIPEGMWRVYLSDFGGQAATSNSLKEEKARITFPSPYFMGEGVRDSFDNAESKSGVPLNTAGGDGEWFGRCGKQVGDPRRIGELPQEPPAPLLLHTQAS